MSEPMTEITEADLRARWPAAFNDARRPLKLGIHRDMGIGHSDAIRRWTAHPRYLRNSIAGGQRIDLDGNPAGEIARQTGRCGRPRARRVTAGFGSLARNCAGVGSKLWLSGEWRREGKSIIIPSRRSPLHKVQAASGVRSLRARAALEPYYATTFLRP